MHGTQSIALTSEDALERGDDICGHHSPNATTVVTCHTNLRPARLHRGAVHVGAAFDDTVKFGDAALTCHLDKMAAFVWAASTPRVVFVCQAGVNRSALAMCYYVAKHGSCNWQEAKAALIAGKGSVGSGWPTLDNTAFEAYLGRRFATPPRQPRSADTEEEEASVKVVAPKWFWRTVSTARRSTGGPGSDPQAAEQSRQEEEATMRTHGIDPKRGRVWGC